MATVCGKIYAQKKSVQRKILAILHLLWILALKSILLHHCNISAYSSIEKIRHAEHSIKLRKVAFFDLVNDMIESKTVCSVKGDSCSSIKESSLDARVSMRKKKPIKSKNTTIPQPDKQDIPRNRSQISIVANFGNGRTGNQMCNIATLYSIYKDFGIRSYISYFTYDLLYVGITNAFSLPKLSYSTNKSFFQVLNPKWVDTRKLNWAHISNKALMHNRSELMSRYINSHFIKLEPYVCDVKGFAPYLSDLRENIFRFKTNAKIKAKNILKKALRNVNKKATVISIHIRMTDIRSHLKTLFNISIASHDYFTRSMEYMTRKFGNNVVFIAFSDDTSNAKRILLTKTHEKFNIIFPIFDQKKMSTKMVLALLSLAEGSILTYSTYGLWGALLRKSQEDMIMPKEIKKTDIGTYVSNSNLTGLRFM